ncbi:hypothetical protein [Nocardia rhizosphaerae]|uniref:Uncharacterized protein n=1 Tax=Nocardia rhizosphaerae TaxID=1691571 RepID=A0ABV8LDC2_9NOCA
MERDRLMQMATTATSRGILNQRILHRLQSVNSIDTHTVSRLGLLRIYKRRLKHAKGNLKLLEQTRNLVEFLSGYPRDELTMITAAWGARDYTLLLADETESQILHWMEMFGDKR